MAYSKVTLTVKDPPIIEAELAPNNTAVTKNRKKKKRKIIKFEARDDMITFQPLVTGHSSQLLNSQSVH